MNKKQFIDKILVKFMSNASTLQAQQIAEDYEQFIPATLDFDYLYEKIITEYTQRSVPQIAHLKQWYKVAEEYIDKKTDLTWKIIAKTAFGEPYEFHYFLSTPESVGKEEFRKNRPELIYVGNNYAEVAKNGN